MRFKIDFRLIGERPFPIPVNYQSDFSTWLHKMLHFQNAKFKEWLEEKKYVDNHGEYRFYTFSDVFFAPGKMQDERIWVEGDKASLFLSFYANDEITPFILEIFNNQEFKLGDSKAKVAIKIESIEQAAIPEFNTAESTVFTTLSPMLITEPGKNNDTYLSPDQKDFDHAFFKNLMFKYANMVKYLPGNNNGLANLNNLKFKLTGKPKTKVIKIKLDTPHQKSVKGFLFDFEVTAPEELLKIGYEAGFGELNNLGFGCCEIKK